MAIRLGDTFPNFQAQTTAGDIDFYEWLGNSWGVFFSHPADYTNVSTIEFSTAVTSYPKFVKRGVKLIALTVDNLDYHKGWRRDVKYYCPKLRSKKLPFPIIADDKRKLATLLGILDPEEKDSAGMPLACRALFIIGPDKKLKLSMQYPASTGLSFEEVIRAVDSLQLAVNRTVYTPENWTAGEYYMITSSWAPDNVLDPFPECAMEYKGLPGMKTHFMIQ